MGARNLLLGSFLVLATACSDDPPSSAPGPEAGAFDVNAAPIPTQQIDASSNPPVDAGAEAAADAGPDGGTTPEAVKGFYNGQWGQLVLRAVGNEVWGAYTHDNGTVRGTIVGDRFVGWWCETPSRMGPSDAGDVEFTFIRGDAGEELRIDGRWRYGGDTATAWREDWDVARVTTPEPPALAERFADASLFCPHP